MGWLAALVRQGDTAPPAPLASPPPQPESQTFRCSKIGLTRAAATRPVHLISDAQQVLAECLLSTLQKYLKVGGAVRCGTAAWPNHT